MSFKKIALLISAAALCSSAYAMDNVTQSIAFSYGGHLAFNSQPHNTSGYKLDYDVMPNNWTWYNNSLVAYMQVNYAHWHTSFDSATSYHTIGVVGVAPVARWYLIPQTSSVTPYLEASIGAAALSHSSFANRNLGSKLLFQDMAGAGVTFGQSKQAFVSLNVLHYSNADLHKNNDGLTIPVMLTVGYNFS